MLGLRATALELPGEFCEMVAARNYTPRSRTRSNHGRPASGRESVAAVNGLGFAVVRRASLLIVPLVVAVGLSGAALAATHSASRSSCTVAPKQGWTSCPHGNLAGRNLARADLRNANLAGTNLTGAKLTQANLATANLARAKLTRARLDDANLTFATLVGALANDANLSRATLNGGSLAHANLTGANLLRANLAGASLVGANLAHANLGLANLAGANLDGRQSHRRNPQHGRAGRDEPESREPDAEPCSSTQP